MVFFPNDSVGWGTVNVLKKEYINLICFYLCCSQKYVLMFLFYTFNTSSDQKTPKPTYLCTCFNYFTIFLILLFNSQYLVSWNTLQQTHEHKENSMMKKKKGRISKTIYHDFCITENKVVGFCCWCSVCFFFPPEMLELRSISRFWY